MSPLRGSRPLRGRRRCAPYLSTAADVHLPLLRNGASGGTWMRSPSSALRACRHGVDEEQPSAACRLRRLRATRAWRLRRRCNTLAFGELRPSGAARFARLAPSAPLQHTRLRRVAPFGRCALRAPGAFGAAETTALRADAAFGGLALRACLRRSELAGSGDKDCDWEITDFPLASLAKVPRVFSFFRSFLGQF